MASYQSADQTVVISKNHTVFHPHPAWPPSPWGRRNQTGRAWPSGELFWDAPAEPSGDSAFKTKNW